MYNFRHDLVDLKMIEFIENGPIIRKHRRNFIWIFWKVSF